MAIERLIGVMSSNHSIFLAIGSVTFVVRNLFNLIFCQYTRKFPFFYRCIFSITIEKILEEKLIMHSFLIFLAK